MKKLNLWSVIMTLKDVLLRKRFTKRSKMSAVFPAEIVHKVQLTLCEIDPLIPPNAAIRRLMDIGVSRGRINVSPEPCVPLYLVSRFEEDGAKIKKMLYRVTVWLTPGEWYEALSQGPWLEPVQDQDPPT